MNELSLFTGAGGGLLGTHLLGWTPVCAVEIEPYCREVLLRRQRDGVLPLFPIWDDVRTFDGRPWRGLVDVVTGGFPCQPFSSAAHGRNIKAPILDDVARIVEEVRPRFVMLENVAERALPAGDRARVSAASMGAAHIRRRWWMVIDADSNGEPGLPFNDEVARMPQFRSDIWKSHPGSLRVAHGVAYRMGRIKAVGNGQVPAVVRAAWEVLTQ